MNIRVDLNTNIADGSEVVFRSPADCSKVTGLVIYHNDGKTEFAFADAHGNNVGDIDHLFAENAVVKVILDVTSSMAFVQNADTNAYIERTFVKSVNGQAPDDEGNVEVNIPEGNNIASPFRGLTASFYGDSITHKNGHYSKGYHSWLKDLLGFDSYNNYGVSGLRTAGVIDKINSIDDTADIIFVMCGVNDQTHSTPLGQFGDTTRDTIYGAYYELCNTLKTKYPSKLIVCITPHYQTAYPHKSNITSYEVGEAMRKTCDLFSMLCYDNRVFSGMYPTNLAVYTTDGCHWNNKGHELVGKNMATWLLSNVGYINTVEKVLVGIDATYTQGQKAVYTTDTLDSLKENLVVVANYNNQTTQVLKSNEYTLSGALTSGVSTITVTYLNKTATFDVTVTDVTVESISAIFDSNGATIYTTDTLDSLKDYLTVTAVYSDGNSKDVTEYVTLSGELTVGVNTITITYQGKTTSFDAEASEIPEARYLTENDIVSSVGISSLSVSDTGAISCACKTFSVLELNPNISKISFKVTGAQFSKFFAFYKDGDNFYVSDKVSSSSGRFLFAKGDGAYTSTSNSKLLTITGDLALSQGDEVILEVKNNVATFTKANAVVATITPANVIGFWGSVQSATAQGLDYIKVLQ